MGLDSAQRTRILRLGGLCRTISIGPSRDMAGLARLSAAGTAVTTRCRWPSTAAFRGVSRLDYLIPGRRPWAYKLAMVARLIAVVLPLIVLGTFGTMDRPASIRHRCLC